MKNSYVNRHDGTSLTLQAICDSDRKFLDVSVDCPSRMHDARVFEWSPISEKIGGICAGLFHLLGDGAYPLRDFLLIPFKDCGNLTPRQKKFNKKLSQTRVKIENCFGLLKRRFRQLKVLEFHSVKMMSKFIFATCVLHNLCIEESDFFDEKLMDVKAEIVNAPFVESSTRLREQGEIKRNYIVDLL